MKARTRLPRRRAAAQAFLLLAIPFVQGSAASVAYAQQASVQGIVTDSASAQPVAGAEVVLEAAGQEVRSILTAGNGLFQIGGLAPGVYRLRITSFGYGVHEETIELEGGERLIANRRLVPAPLRLQGVGVVDRGAGAMRRELGRQTITARELRRIPTPATGDLVSYLLTVPGVVGTGDRGGQLFIRGGTPSENMVLMDGMLIYQPFHITGFSSVFPADLVHSAEFFPGGFGAKYSGRVSSVLDVAMRDGNRSEHALTASVSPFLAEVVTEGPLRGGGGSSYIVSLRRSLIEETSPWLLGEDQPLRFDSYYLKLSSFGRDGGSRCSLTTLRSSDRGGLDPEDEESRVGWTNFLIGGRCSSLASETFLEGRFGYSRVSSEAITRGASEFSSSASRVSLSGDASRTLGRVRLSFGGFSSFKYMSHDFLEFRSRDERSSGWAEAGLYAEADIPIGAGIRLLPGATLTWVPRTSPSLSVEPRLRASWRPGGLADAELSGTLGLYGQRIAGISDRRDASSVFTAWMRPPDDSRIRAIHAQMSWQQSLGGGFSWSVDGYYRRMYDLPVTTWSPVATFTSELSLADGRARGADARVELRRGPFYGFAGYSHGWTEYESAQDDFGVWFGEPVLTYHPSHDRRHQANALASLELGRYTVAARWEFGSGFPFTRIIGFDEVLDFRTGLPLVKGTYGQTRVLLDRPFDGRLPPTHRLDVSLERLVDIGSRQLRFQAGVINVYDRTNIFYYDIFTTRRVDQLPLAPYLSVRLEPRPSAGR